MATKLAYRDGGNTSEEGIQKIIGALLSRDGVIVDCLPTEAGTPDNTVRIASGSELALADSGPVTDRPDYYYYAWVTSEESVTIAANVSGNARIDAIVAYIDMTVVDDTDNDNPGALKFYDVQGTPAGSPVAPDSTAIVTAIGAGNPYVLLANVAVANGFSSITDSDITDARTFASNYILNGGWTYSQETWTYASATSFTIAGDVTDKYSIGDKIKLTQTTVKYFYITGVSYGAPNTTITVTGGTTYTLASAAITENYYSKLSNPVGHPIWFAYTPTRAVSGGTAPDYTANDVNRFKVNGREVTVQSTAKNSSGGTAGAGANVMTITLPITSVNTYVQNESILGSGYFFETGTTELANAVWYSTTQIVIKLTGGGYVAGDSQSETDRRIGYELRYEI